MKCNWEWISAYLDGLLSDDKRAKLEEHLKTCEACAAKLEEFAQVETTAKKIPVPQLSEAYWENFAGRVQNKLTIREKQRTTPTWLEALKNFFQPTTGKLAIAGSLATILLVAIIGRDYWKKESYQPPKFEVVAPPANDKIDSVQEPAKDESAFRAARPDDNKATVDKKRENDVVPAKAANKGIIESREAAPAALAPAEIAYKSAGRQKTKEEPSLAGYVERDEAAKKDTVLVTAGKKAEIRKEVATSQVKVAAEEIEKLPIRNVESLLKVQTGAPKREIRPTSSDSQITFKESFKHLGAAHIRGGRQPVQGDTLTVTAGRSAEIRKEIATSRDTAQLIFDLRQIIAKKEKELRDNLSKSETEFLYIYLAQCYVQLCRYSLKHDDWKRANQQLRRFLKAELSDSARRWLVAIQAELQKLKK